MSKTKTVKSLLCVAMAILFAISGVISAYAEEAAATVTPAEVVEKIAALPTNADLVTVNDKETILAAKTAYNSLTAEQKMEVPVDSVTVLNAAYNALLPYLLADVVQGVKKLPKTSKLKASDKAKVVELYNSYLMLDDTCKEAFSSTHYKTLMAAMKKLAPDEIDNSKDSKAKSSSEKSASSDDEDDTSSKTTSKAKTKLSSEKLQKIWQTVLIILVSVIVLCALAAMIILIIKIIKLGR